MEPAILYVDDEAPNLDLFQRRFDEEFRIVTAASGEDALALLAAQSIGVLVADQRMPGMTGVELLAQAATRWPGVSRILLTAYSDRDLLLSAIQRGQIHDYVLKPWSGDDLSIRLRQRLDAFVGLRDLEKAAGERDFYARELQEQAGFQDMVGLRGGLAPLAMMLERVAASDATVMIRGESGSGKELVARELHRRSARAAGPFVRVNCAAFSEGVLESELFGHEAGAFTGARAARRGRFEQADGGTLFLDEIGDVAPALQVKLLRVLQERELERVGGNRTIHVDIRVLAATHRNLEELISDGRFRADLFYRLNVVPLQVPPLRARGEDIAPLANYFLARFAREMGKRLAFSDAALLLLGRYDWPGNVRELRNVVERAAVLADAQALLEADDLIFDAAAPAAPPTSITEEIAQHERQKIVDALKQAAGSKARAARLLGIPRTTLNERMRKHNIR
jgi:DNA-binding NtrC family response regulator